MAKRKGRSRAGRSMTAKERKTRRGAPSAKGKKTTTKGKPKHTDTTQELVPMMDADVATLIPKRRRDSLLAWFELYMGTEAGPADSNTFKAKKRDLEAFASYLQTACGTDHPDQWTKSLTESFLRHLSKQQGLAPTSVNRVLATLKHVAIWIDLKRPLLVGNPCDRVQNLDVDEPEWGGLSDLQVNRLKSAAEQLCHGQTRASQQPLRDQALFLSLLHTAMRVSELLALDLKQYKQNAFHNIQRKGKKVTRKLRVPKAAREAIDAYIQTTRGRSPGPLFRSKTGKRLAVQNVDDALKKIANQANTSLPVKEQLHLSAHMLRHTCLRKAAEKDIRYAMKLSGHTTSQYIWRYTEPPDSEFDQAMEGLYD